MTATYEINGFLGAWRWLVEANTVTAGEKLARVYSIPTDEARDGVALEIFAHAVHPDDRALFDWGMKTASRVGGDLNLDYRVIDGTGGVRRVVASGSCVRFEHGRPVEFLGAMHAIDDIDDDPLSMAADHLLAAAQIARMANEATVSLFVDMALTETANRMAVMLTGKCTSLRPYRTAS